VFRIAVAVENLKDPSDFAQIADPVIDEIAYSCWIAGPRTQLKTAPVFHHDRPSPNCNVLRERADSMIEIATLP
jgi:hypothetical protein